MSAGTYCKLPGCELALELLAASVAAGLNGLYTTLGLCFFLCNAAGTDGVGLGYLDSQKFGGVATPCPELPAALGMGGKICTGVGATAGMGGNVGAAFGTGAGGIVNMGFG